MRAAVATDQAPRAIGPYSQGIASAPGRLLFCSGTVGADAHTGELVSPDVAAQAKQVMKNLGAVLTAAGASFDHVVKCTLFLTDLSDFGTVNEIYGAHFTQPPPARTTIQVAALPRGARVEVEAIALLP